MITYRDSVQGITSESVRGFFVGWPKPPSETTLLRILNNSMYVVIAIDDDTGQMVGFINAIADGVLAAYIPLLEVLPDYQGRKIGTELVSRMLGKLERYYMVDLLCDEALEPFYRRFNLKSAHAMAIRRYEYQAGIES